MTKVQLKKLKVDIRESVRTRGVDLSFWLGYLYGLFDFNVVTEPEYLNLKDHMYKCFIGEIK
jgi:hypothetical protein